VSARVITDEITNAASRVEIKCDVCGVEAPPAADILAGHGLNRMGWHCSGGTHICPLHEHPRSADGE